MFSQLGAFAYNTRKLTLFQKPQENKIQFFGHKTYSSSKLAHKIKHLQISCGVFLDPTIRSTIIREKESTRLLKSIIQNSDRETLQSAEIGILIQCSLILVQAYVAHLNVRVNFWDRFKPKPYNECVKYFHLLIFKLIPELSDIVIELIMDFFKAERLWHVEFMCAEILMSLLACDTSSAKILVQLLDFTEEELVARNVKSARHVFRVLHKTLHEPFWNQQKAADCERLIQLYHRSISAEDSEDPYFKMERCFNLCLTRMCEIIKNIELINMIGVMFDFCFGNSLKPEGIYAFSHIIETAIIYADIKSISQALEPQILKYLFKAIASDNPKTSKVGCRLLARLCDRHGNFAEFITPRIFFAHRQYKIHISVLHQGDIDFLKGYRIDIENNLLTACRLHQTTGILEIIFTILCTILVEAPCGFTAVQVIAIVLEIQEHALTLNDHKSCKEANQMHAAVLSVMSLIAWIHRATSFSVYVQRILNRRADDAPHLNPPIKIAYQYAQHHIMWNEPKLFFDFWDVRFGLWKRFRCNEPQLPVPDNFVYRKFDEYESRSSKRDRVRNEIIASSLVRESAETFF